MGDMTTRCRFCGEEILAVAKKCKHCGSNLDQSVAAPSADYGPILLAIPVVSTMLIWFWVANMNMFQDPGGNLSLIMIATIVSTGSLAAAEASRLGMTTDRNKGTYSPTAWFFIVVGMWVIGYPAYLLKRKHYGLANRMVAGILVGLLFIGSWSAMSTAIEDKKAEIRTNLGM